MKYLIHTVKGLESIVMEEIYRCLPGATILFTHQKRIGIEYQGAVTDLFSLRTADDAGFLLWDGSFSNEDELLAHIADLTENLKLQEIKENISNFRYVDNDHFSITVSKYKASIDKNKLIQTFSNGIIEKYGWKFEERDHTNFDIRIDLDGDVVFISIRIGNESLYRRKYITSSYLGALRPSIASVMVLFATKGEKGLSLVDNYCGSGTILAEAFEMGCLVAGGDFNPNAVRITKNVLHALKAQNTDQLILEQNATQTLWHHGVFDCVVSNLPWNKQVTINNVNEAYRATIAESIRITKPRAKYVFLVHKPELFVKYVHDLFGKDIDIDQYRIGYLGQTPSIIVVKS